MLFLILNKPVTQPNDRLDLLAGGTQLAAQAADVAPEVARIKAATDLPVIVGFGITTPEAAQTIAGVADGCVVGSAIVKEIAAGRSVPEVLAFVQRLTEGAHSA